MSTHMMADYDSKHVVHHLIALHQNQFPPSSVHCARGTKSAMLRSEGVALLPKTHYYYFAACATSKTTTVP